MDECIFSGRYLDSGLALGVFGTSPSNAALGHTRARMVRCEGRYGHGQPIVARFEFEFGEYVFYYSVHIVERDRKMTERLTNWTYTFHDGLGGSLDMTVRETHASLGS